MSERYYGLDFARSILMLTGVVFHTSLIYKISGDWRVDSLDGHLFFDKLSEFTHHFRMEAFYIIAGIFFMLVCEKRNRIVTLKDRLIKIGVPLIVVGMSLNFAMNYLSENRVYGYGFTYYLKGEWLGHLWFIGNLICYYIITILVVEKFKTNSRIPIPSFFLLMISIAAVPLMSIFLVKIGGKILSGQFIFVSFISLFKYFPYYLLGMLVWADREAVLKMATVRNSVALAIISFCLLLVENFISNKEINSIIFSLIYAATSTILAITAIFALHAVGNKRSVLVKKITDSSYTIYLLHQPLIVILYSYVISNLDWNIFVEFTIIILTVFSTTYAFHVYVIEKLPAAGFLFNGIYKKKAKKPFQAKATS